MPRVVFNEEPEAGLGFEIRHQRQKMPGCAQYLTDGQSDCICRLYVGGNGGPPKEVTLSTTTARVDNNEVLRDCLGGRDLRIPTSAKGGPRSLEEWRARHTHTLYIYVCSESGERILIFPRENFSTQIHQNSHTV